MKTCKKCKVEKSLTNFSKRTIAEDGLSLYCKECDSKAHKKYSEENPFKVKQSRHKAYKKHYFENPGYYDYVNKAPNRLKITNKWKNSWGSGVYGIFSEGKALYIGETTQLKKRITEHISYIKNPSINKSYLQEMYWEISNKKNYIIGIIEETPNHKERELHYINQLKPLYNK